MALHEGTAPYDRNLGTFLSTFLAALVLKVYVLIRIKYDSAKAVIPNQCSGLGPQVLPKHLSTAPPKYPIFAIKDVLDFKTLKYLLLF